MLEEFDSNNITVNTPRKSFIRTKKGLAVLLSVLIIIAIIGGASGYMVWNRDKRTPETNISYSNPSITPSPTITNSPTISPTPDPKRTTLEMINSDKSITPISVVLPSNTTYKKLTFEDSKAEPKDHFVGLFYTQYEITRKDNPSLFSLKIAKPYEGQEFSYPEVVDLKPTEYFQNLYRVRISNQKNGLWGYVTSISFDKDCTLSYSTNKAKPPCGPWSLYQNVTMWLQVYCDATTDAGLKVCDDIVKSIRYAGPASKAIERMDLPMVNNKPVYIDFIVPIDATK
jgi:hypothetical protein